MPAKKKMVRCKGSDQIVPLRSFPWDLDLVAACPVCEKIKHVTRIEPKKGKIKRHLVPFMVPLGEVARVLKWQADNGII